MVDYREILRLDNLGYTKKDIASCAPVKLYQGSGIKH